MQQGFVNINNVPTKVITYGRWITDEPEVDEEKIILVIPGNPGVTGFYKLFMEILYEKHNCPVWIVGHSGHELPNQKSPEASSPDLIGLKEQIEQKVTFIENYIPEKAKLHVIGHSIGGYMTLQLLKEPSIAKRIVKTYLLFPTIEKMAEAPNGKFLYRYVRPITSVVIYLTWILTILPKIVFMNLLAIYMWIANVPDKDIDAILSLLKPKVLEQVFYLAFQELDQVKDRDNDILRRNLSKVRILYGENDGWYLSDSCTNIKKDFPEIQAIVSAIDHSFIFHENKAVAEIVNTFMKL